jgi:hypothetical protein
VENCQAEFSDTLREETSVPKPLSDDLPCRANRLQRARDAIFALNLPRVEYANGAAPAQFLSISFHTEGFPQRQFANIVFWM